MSKRIYLALAIHNHQPVGNFDHVFEQAYREAYEPMVAALERHPQIRLALHYSGPLRDWLAAHYPGFSARVRSLVERGQVEAMTGAYYEPILVSIPDADKLGQLHKMREEIRRDYGVEATGLWLAERVWEPHLPLILAQAGIDYTIVDDTHFRYVGLQDKDLFGYYVTEEQGAPLKVFGTSKYLRYVVPWATVPEVIEYLRGEADAGPKVAVMGDDGEKFGLWPGTHKHVWQEGWMERFFEAIEENSDWLQMITPGEYSRTFPSLGRIYLPATAYDEMGEWSLPPSASWEITHLKHRLQEEQEEDVLRFIRGGFWRSFLVKYPEINTMHKKMLLVSEVVRSLPPSPARESALEALWAGQCNCPYWHGVFGGAYLLHIRTANWERLLTAENLADRQIHPEEQWVAWREMDLDRDADTEVLLSGDSVNLYFDPSDGGSCFEWDWRARSYNLANVMSRRPEGYHRDLVLAAAQGKTRLAGLPQEEAETIHTTAVRVKEPGLENRLHYDWYRHGSFVDHFLRPDVAIDDVVRAQFGEIGDFVNRPYTYAVSSPPGGPLTLTLRREGHVWQGDCFCDLRLEKEIRIRPGSPDVEARYTLTNTSRLTLTPHFAVETVWSLLGGNGPTASAVVPESAALSLNEPVATSPAPEISLYLGWLNMAIRLTFSQPAGLWLFPIETINNSEGGFERIYQGTCLLARWPLQLAPGDGWSVTLCCEPRTTPSA